MKTLEKIHRILGIPALIVHELSHILMGYVFGKKFESVEINMIDRSKFKFEVKTFSEYSNKKSVTILMAVAPCITLLIFIIFSFFSIVVFIITMYLLIFINYSFMSASDAEVVLHYDRTMERRDEEWINNLNEYANEKNLENK